MGSLNVFSIYLPEIRLKYGFSDSQVSLLTTIRSLTGLIGLLFAKKVTAKYSLRLIIAFGCSAMVASYAMFAVTSSFFAYLLASALMGFGYSFCGSVPTTLAIHRWFHTRQSLALGLASMSSGICSLATPTGLTMLMETLGLSTAFWVNGGVIAAFAGLTVLLMRNDPADMGLAPYGEGGVQAVRQLDQNRVSISHHQHHMLLLCALLLGLSNSGPYGFLPIHYRTLGYDSMLVAALFSVAGATLAIGKVGVGQLFDRLGSFRTHYVVLGTAFAGFFLACLAPTGSVPLAVVGFALSGVGLTAATMCCPRWAGDLYSEQDYASALVTITTMVQIGPLIMSPLAGVLADRFGNYIPIFALYTVLTAILLVLIQRLYIKADAVKPASAKAQPSQQTQR